MAYYEKGKQAGVVGSYKVHSVVVLGKLLTTYFLKITPFWSLASNFWLNQTHCVTLYQISHMALTALGIKGLYWQAHCEPMDLCIHLTSALKTWFLSAQSLQKTFTSYVAGGSLDTFPEHRLHMAHHTLNTDFLLNSKL